MAKQGTQRYANSALWWMQLSQGHRQALESWKPLSLCESRVSRDTGPHPLDVHTHTHTHIHTQIYFKELALTCEVSKSAGQSGWGHRKGLMWQLESRLSTGRNSLFYPAHGPFLLRPSTCRMRPTHRMEGVCFTQSLLSPVLISSQHLHSSLRTGIWPDPWCWVHLTRSLVLSPCQFDT